MLHRLFFFFTETITKMIVTKDMILKSLKRYTKMIKKEKIKKEIIYVKIKKDQISF